MRALLEKENRPSLGHAPGQISSAKLLLGKSQWLPPRLRLWLSRAACSLSLPEALSSSWPSPATECGGHRDCTSTPILGRRREGAGDRSCVSTFGLEASADKGWSLPTHWGFPGGWLESFPQCLPQDPAWRSAPVYSWDSGQNSCLLRKMSSLNWAKDKG